MAEWWTAELLDNRERYKGQLGEIVSGHLDWSIFRDVHGQGSIEIVSPTTGPDLNVNWLTDRIRIIHHTDASGTDVTTPFGTWLIDMPGSETTGPVTSRALKIADKLHVPNRSVTGQWWNMWKGRVITRWVQGLLWELGERKFAIEHDLDAAVAANMHWDHDATWLKIMNDLLAAAGYESLWVDAEGYFRAHPYIPPGKRPIIREYGEDAHLMLPDWRDEAPLDIPNLFAFFVPGDEETEGYWVHARNDDPDSPFSIPSRAPYYGRRYGEVVQSDQGEASSRAAAQAIADRKLAEASQVTRRATITHPVDDTWPGDVVKHGPLDLAGPIVARDVELGIGPVVEDTIRHIYTGGDAPWT